MLIAPLVLLFCFLSHVRFFPCPLFPTVSFSFLIFHLKPFLSPLQIVKWGSVSLADAERRLLANALLDFSNDHFILLSESCIPVYNFPTVYKYLTRSLHSFVDSYDDPSRYGRGRYSRRMGPSIRLSDWRKGPQWFEVNRTLAINIVSDTKYFTIFKMYCTPACYPDEHYIPTFIHMFSGTFNANRSMTWVDWSLSGHSVCIIRSIRLCVTFLLGSFLRMHWSSYSISPQPYWNFEILKTCFFFCTLCKPQIFVGPFFSGFLVVVKFWQSFFLMKILWLWLWYVQLLF